MRFINVLLTYLLTNQLTMRDTGNGN